MELKTFKISSQHTSVIDGEIFTVQCLLPAVRCAKRKVIEVTMNRGIRLLQSHNFKNFIQSTRIF